MRKPPIQAPRIAGAPATSASAASRRRPTRSPPAIGAAMPSPSVMLWTMKPMIRNVPSASSPSAIDEPIARPSPRLWSPIPIATSVASATPSSGALRRVPSRREPLRDEGEAEVAGGDPEQDQARPLEAARKARLEVERLGERVEREEAEQPGGQRHEGGHPARVGAAERGQPRQPERDRNDHRRGDRSARSRESRAGRAARLDRGRALERLSMPVELVTPTV